jgi:hypothetical protein
MKRIKREWSLFGQSRGIVETYDDDGRFVSAHGWHRNNRLVRILR